MAKKQSAKMAFKNTKGSQRPLDAVIAELNFDPVVDLELKNGPLRKYISTDAPADLTKLRLIRSNKEKILLFLLTVLSLAVRASFLSWPNIAVVEEDDTLYKISKILNRTFFVDIQPPLGRYIYAAIGYLRAFPSSFDFEQNSYREFANDVPYVSLRLISALFGAFVVPVFYATLRVSGVRVCVALCSALTLVIENSFVSTSRHVFVDSPFLLAVMVSVYFFKRSELYSIDSCGAFKNWFYCGIALGVALSIKYTGIFTVVWCLVVCLWKLWLLLGDLSKPINRTASIAGLQVATLFVVPVFIYFVVMTMHVSNLVSDGEGSLFLSAQYRCLLKGNECAQNVPADVSVRSTISLRHLNTKGGYLHANGHQYEQGSKQLQIGLYPYVDHKNQWEVELYDVPNENITSFQNLTDGTKIRLLNPVTHCRLHSHDHKPPVSEYADWQKEVTCYGFDGFQGDPNDDWIIEIDQDSSSEGLAQERIRAIDTKFRLKHAMTGCYLFSHHTRMNDNGFLQQEVTCAYFAKPKTTLWYVEDNVPLFDVPNKDTSSYPKISLWERVKEMHSAMNFFHNHAYDPEDSESDPISWPIMGRGMPLARKPGWQDYLIGNAVVWWSVSAFVVFFVMLIGYELIMWQLGRPITNDKYIVNFHLQVFQYLAGFVAQYLPFFAYKQPMFILNYLPAYLFGMLAFAHAMDMALELGNRNRKNAGYVIISVFLVCCYYFFWNHKSLTFATKWAFEICKKSKWLSNWDYTCEIYIKGWMPAIGADVPRKSIQLPLIAPNTLIDPLAAPTDVLRGL